jgi:hypothetical protein
MRKSIYSALLIILGLAVAPAAKATSTNVSGYVCNTTYTLQNNVWYGQGYVTVVLYSAASCSGTNLGTFYYLGSGASNPGSQLSQAEKLQLFHEAVEAAKDGTHVTLYADNSGNGIWDTTYSAN